MTKSPNVTKPEDEQIIRDSERRQLIRNGWFGLHVVATIIAIVLIINLSPDTTFMQLAFWFSIGLLFFHGANLRHFSKKERAKRRTLGHKIVTIEVPKAKRKPNWIGSDPNKPKRGE